MESSRSVTIVDSLVHDVSYDYQLFERAGKLNCSGVIKFSVSVPETATRIVIYRSMRHKPFQTNGNVLWLNKQEYPITTKEIEYSNAYWNTHFMLCVYLENDNYVYSRTYTISDYIDEEDLALLNQQSSVEDVDVKDVKIHAENGILNVEATENIVLSVYDLFGNCLFCGDINGTHSISLKNLSTPFIILRYSNSVSTKTQKILVR